VHFEISSPKIIADARFVPELSVPELGEASIFTMATAIRSL
jgi:hypothetical protein